MTLEALINERDVALASSDQILRTIERAKRLPTAPEQSNLDTNRKTVERLTPQIDTLQKARRDPDAVRKELQAKGFKFDPQPLFSADERGVILERILPKRLSSEYYDAFRRNVPMGEGRNSPAIQAALQEAVSTSGGLAIPIMVEQQVQTLVPTASEIEDVATVIVTDRDILIPSTPPGGLPSAEIVSETNAFNQPVATLQQTKLKRLHDS